MITSYILIILFSFQFFSRADSFYLGDSRYPRYARSSEKNDENSIAMELKKGNLRRNEEAFRRDSSRLFGNQGSFIKCVFIFHNSGKPEYKCDHSGDVKINWQEENGRLIGTFETNFHCPTKRDVIDRIPRNNSDEKLENWKYARREKRRTIFKDDAEYKDSDNDEQVDDEESVASENVRQSLWDDDNAEESQPAESPNEGEEIAAEENPEASITEPENEKDKDIPDTVEETEEVNNIEQEPGEPRQEPDKEVPPPETPPAVPDESKPENGAAPSNVTEDEGDEEGEIVEAGVILIDVELDKLLPSAQQVSDFISDVGTIISDAGDYLISLVLGRLKRRLRMSRIHEKFNEKVEELTKKYGGDSAKALRVMQKRIHNRLGKAYELEIVKLLIDLRDGMKT